jgi:hypothetical protein
MGDMYEVIWDYVVGSVGLAFEERGKVVCFRNIIDVIVDWIMPI